MRIGIAYDLKPEGPLPDQAPDDLYEEFDAPSTIEAIADVLRSLGHTVTLLGNGRPLLEALLCDAPDLVFNFAEGSGISRTREARVPAVCEMLGIPYTGSDPLTLSVGLDKDISRRLVEAAGVAVPRGMIFTHDVHDYDGDFAEFPPLLTENGLTLPVIAKPTYEGSSKGVHDRCLIRDAAELGPIIARLRKQYEQPILVEEFIAGQEVTIGLVGNDPPQVVGIMAIHPKTPTEHFVYSLEVKRNYEERVEYECPARLPNEMTRAIESAALTAWDALGCRDVARFDFRIRDNVPYFLEVNPLPGLNPVTSDLVILARMVNISHAELITMIVEAAMVRQGLKPGVSQ